MKKVTKIKKSEFRCGCCDLVFKIKDAVVIPAKWRYGGTNEELFVCVRCGLEEVICYIRRKEMAKKS